MVVESACVCVSLPNCGFEPVTYLQTASQGSKVPLRLSLSFLEMVTHTYTLAQMKSNDEYRQYKSPLASFSVNVSSWETEACLLVSVCMFVHDSLLAVNYVILLILLHCCLMEQLFDGMSVYLCVRVCVCVCLSPGLVDSHR